MKGSSDALPGIFLSNPSWNLITQSPNDILPAKRQGGHPLVSFEVLVGVKRFAKAAKEPTNLSSDRAIREGTAPEICILVSGKKNSAHLCSLYVLMSLAQGVHVHDAACTGTV